MQEMLLWYARHVPFHRGKQRLTEALRRLFNISLEGEFIEQREGLTWALDARDESSQDLFWASAKDRAELNEILKVMRPGGVMLDLGANFGYYSIKVATALGGDCRIYAFEPNPSTMARFRTNLERNAVQGVFPIDAGVSDAPGGAEIVKCPGHSGAAYLREPRGDAADVRVTTIDHFCASRKIDRLDLIKMDIEGTEIRALRGGGETIARFRPAILLEVNPETLAREGSLASELVVLLENLGYMMHSVRPRLRVTRDRIPANPPIFNVICRVC